MPVFAASLSWRILPIVGLLVLSAASTCGPGDTETCAEAGSLLQRKSKVSVLTEEDSITEDLTSMKALGAYTAYEFSVESEMIFQPSENHCESILDREATVRCDAIIGDLAVMKGINSQGRCQRNTKYLHSDFKVQKGAIRGTDGSNTIAYKLFPPAVRAVKFATHATVPYFRAAEDFPGGNMSLWKFTESVRTLDSNFQLVGHFQADGGKFNSTHLNFDQLDEAGEVFVFQAQMPHHDHFHPVAEGVRMADLTAVQGDSPGPFQLQATVFTLAAGTPWSEARDLPNYGPGKLHGGRFKTFFPVSSNVTSEGVVWQDQSTHRVYVTWVNPLQTDGLVSSSQETRVMDDTPGEMLVAAASNTELSRIALVKCKIRDEGYDVGTPAEIRMVMIDASTGRQLNSAVLDASKETGLKTAKCGLVGGTLAWEPVSNKLLLILGRQIIGGHQGAGIGLYDGESMAMEGRFSGMSHSFGNNAQELGNGTFLTAELGDQRGIAVMRISARGHDPDRPGQPQSEPRKDSWTPYTYKALHSKNAKGAELYPEMSKDGVERYKRSNDNRCYSEIAFNTFISVDGGAASLMFFTGEFPALDYTDIGSGSMVKSRNLAFIKLSNDISKREILSDGPGAEPEEHGGYYSYWGNWKNQTVKGVHLLTRFQNRTAESAAKPKAVRIGPNRILCLFEVWVAGGRSYDRTMALVVDDAGSVVEPARDLLYDLRLPYSDRLRLAGEGSDWRAVWYSGLADGRLARFELGERSPVAADAGAQTSAPPSSTAPPGSPAASTAAPSPACIPASAPPPRPCDPSCSDYDRPPEAVCRKDKCSGCSMCADIKFCQSKCGSSRRRFGAKPWSTKCQKWYCRDCEECLALS